MYSRSILKLFTTLPLRSLLVVGLLAGLSAQFAEARPSARAPVTKNRAIQQIAVLRQAKSYDKARQTAERLLSSYPHDAEAHLAMAGVLRDMGLTSEAINEYTRAFHLRPAMVDALVPLSELQIKTGNPTLGMSYARMAVMAAPKSSQTRKNLIQALIATNNVEEAERELTSSLKTANPDIAIMASELSRKKGDYGLAKRQLEAAIRQSPRNTKLLFRLAELLNSVDDHKGAVAALERAVNLEPNAIEAREKLALTLENGTWDFPGAIKEYRTILEINPDCVAAVCGIARCESKSKDPVMQLQRSVHRCVTDTWRSISSKPSASKPSASKPSASSPPIPDDRRRSLQARIP